MKVFTYLGVYFANEIKTLDAFYEKSLADTRTKASYDRRPDTTINATKSLKDD